MKINKNSIIKTCKTCTFDQGTNCNVGTYYAERGKSVNCYNGELWKQKGIIKNTYNIKLFTSKRVRYLMSKDIPQFCLINNCLSTLSVKNKWYWLYDHYELTIIGELSDIENIEIKLKTLTKMVIL